MQTVARTGNGGAEDPAGLRFHDPIIRSFRAPAAPIKGAEPYDAQVPAPHFPPSLSRRDRSRFPGRAAVRAGMADRGRGRLFYGKTAADKNAPKNYKNFCKIPSRRASNKVKGGGKLNAGRSF